MIDPDLWSDDKVSILSLQARLLYIGAISLADDAGRLEWSWAQLRNRILVGVPVEPAEVRLWMDEIETAGLVEVYDVGGRLYAAHPAWTRHQYVNRPSKSKLPRPDGTYDEEPVSGKINPRSRGVATKFREDSVKLTERPVFFTEPHVPLESESESDITSSASLRTARAESAHATSGKGREWVPAPLPPEQPRKIPSERESLKSLARWFMAEYGQILDPAKQDKAMVYWAGVLDALRNRGATTQEAVSAFTQARQNKNGAPLFGAEVKLVMLSYAAKPAVAQRRAAVTYPEYAPPEPPRKRGVPIATAQ